MQYVLVEKFPNMTVGKVYKEYFPYPNPFNAGVWNDKGEFDHVPRKKHLRVVSQGVLYYMETNCHCGSIREMLENENIIETMIEVDECEYLGYVLYKL